MQLKSWMALVILFAAPSIAADQSAPPANLDDLFKQFGDMQRQLGTLSQENAKLRSEVDQLRSEDDGWLTEQRAAEIRQLVQDVIADSETRASLLQSGMTAGWNDGFFLASPDGDYSLHVDGLMQIRYIYSTHDAPDRNRGGFENTRTKLTFRGNTVTPDIKYLIRGNFERREDSQLGDDFVDNPQPGGEFELEDAWIRYDLNNQFNLRVGQFKLPFNREELVSPAMQLAVERSAVNQNLNLGRSQGIQAEWVNNIFRVVAVFSDGANDEVGGEADVDLTGTLNPANMVALRQDVEYALTGRAEWLVAGNWKQFEDFTSPITDEFGLMFGGAIHYQKNEANNVPSFAQNETPWTAVTLDASAEFGGASLFASMFWHYFDRSGGDFNIWAAVIQGSVYVMPKWEIYVRYEHGSWDFEGNDNFADLSLMTVGSNYYFKGHTLKATSDIGVAFDQVELLWDSDIAGLRKDPEDSDPQIIIRAQLQLLF